MFEQLIDAYVKKLTPDIIKKFACSNGIELTDSESGEAYLFIQKHYKTILYNKNELLLDDLMKKELPCNSYDKLKKVLLLARNKYGI